MSRGIGTESGGITCPESRGKVSTVDVSDFGEKMDLEIQAAEVEIHDALATEFRKLINRIHDGDIVFNSRGGTVQVADLNGSINGSKEVACR